MGGSQVVGLTAGVLGAVDLEQVVRGSLVRAAEAHGELGGRGNLHVIGNGELIGSTVNTGEGEETYVHVLCLCRPGHEVVTGDGEGAGPVIIRSRPDQWPCETGTLDSEIVRIFV